MEVRLQKDQLTALYWPASPLLDIDLNPEALHRVKHCTVDSCYAHDFNYALEPDPRKANQLHITQLLKDPQRPYRALFPWLAQTFCVYRHETSPGIGRPPRLATRLPLWPGPALGRAQHNHRPARPNALPGLLRLMA